MEDETPLLSLQKDCSAWILDAGLCGGLVWLPIVIATRWRKALYHTSPLKLLYV